MIDQMNLWNTVWTAVGGAVTALALVAFFGRTLLTHWFGKDLERYKQQLAHEGAQELVRLQARNTEQLEQLRYKLDTALKQTSRLHEKEFFVLERAWPLLNLAMGHVADIVSSFQQYPDFERMNDEQLENFLANSNLDELDRKELRSAKDPNKFYQRRIFWYRLRDAKRASRRLHRVVHANSIFIEPSIRERLIKIEDLIWNALVAREIGHEAEDHKLWIEASDRLKKEIEPLKGEIEKGVQKRLGYQ